MFLDSPYVLTDMNCACLCLADYGEFDSNHQTDGQEAHWNDSPQSSGHPEVGKVGKLKGRDCDDITSEWWRT